MSVEYSIENFIRNYENKNVILIREEPNMKLNKEMVESVKKELGKIADNELNDDFLEEVSGGRDLNRNESAGLIMIYQVIARTYAEKNMSRELFISTLDALENYEKYIKSLPEGTDTVLFDYEKFKN